MDDVNKIISLFKAGNIGLAIQLIKGQNIDLGLFPEYIYLPDDEICSIDNVKLQFNEHAYGLTTCSKIEFDIAHNDLPFGISRVHIYFIYFTKKNIIYSGAVFHINTYEYPVNIENNIHNISIDIRIQDNFRTINLL